MLQICPNYYKLKFRPPNYFEIPFGPISSESGWYIILENKNPIYVGKAKDLNARLNTSNRSLDNFANKDRKSDSKRNFIKKFAELEIFSKLRVCIIKEKDIRSELGINTDTLSNIDRDNVEKFIDIFKCCFNYY